MIGAPRGGGRCGVGSRDGPIEGIREFGEDWELELEIFFLLIASIDSATSL